MNKVFYDSNGYLDAVNSEEGVTLAVLTSVDGERVLHPDYDNEVGREVIAGLLLFDPAKVAPPVIEPEPEE